MLYRLSLFYAVLTADKRHLTRWCYSRLSMLALSTAALGGRGAFGWWGTPARLLRRRQERVSARHGLVFR
ncbi:MAG: hypothetical protein H7836_15300 [Magnetococcus sp. YQC-3]